MAVDYDATSAPTDGNSLSWSHTSGVGARAGVVFAYYTTFDTIGFTWNGVAMTQVSGPDDEASGGELQFSRVGVWLLDNIGDDETITVASTGGTAVIKSARAYSLTADDEVEFIDEVIFDSAALANPSGTITADSRDIFVAQIFASGQDAATGVTPLTDWTNDRETDNGTNIRGEYRYDTVSDSNVTVGWTQTSEDAFGVAAGFSEIAATPDALLAEDVESASSVTTPSVGQEHDLTSSDAQSTSEVTSPAVGQAHALTAASAESASEVTTPSLIASGSVVVTDVDSDETWDDGDTGLVITGTGFV